MRGIAARAASSARVVRSGSHSVDLGLCRIDRLAALGGAGNNHGDHSCWRLGVATANGFAEFIVCRRNGHSLLESAATVSGGISNVIRHCFLHRDFVSASARMV